MPELKGFQPRQTRVEQAPTVTTPALGMAAQQLDTLSNRLEKFSSVMMQQHAEVTADKAKDDALNDAAQGKPFHKEEVYTIYGKAYNNTLSATYAANAEISISNKSNMFALQFENDPTGYGQAMDEYVNGMVANAPTPELRTAIGIYGKKTSNSGFGSLARAEHARLKAYQKEVMLQNIGQTIPQIVNMHNSGDTAGADVAQQAKLQYIRTLTDAGMVTPTEAEKIVKDSTFKIHYGMSMGVMDNLLKDGNQDEAYNYLIAQTEKNRDDMDTNENKKHKADLTRKYNTYLTKQKAAKTAQGKTANIALSDAIKVMKANKTPDNIEDLRTVYPMASETKKHEFDIQSQVAEITASYSGYSITQQEDAYNTMVGTKEADRVGVEVMDAIGQNLKQRATAAKDDVVGLYLRETGEKLPPMGSDAGLEGLIKGLEVMKGHTEIIQQKYGQDKTDMLSKQDAVSWAGYMNSKDISVDDKLQFIATVAGYNPEQKKTIFRQIGGKNAPTFAFSASLALAGNDAAAKTALIGKGAEVVLPENYANDMKTKLGNAFGGYTGEVFNRNYRGVMDYAKGMSLQGEPIDDYEDIIKTSIGEIRTYNDKDTVLPQGVEEDSFEEWLDNIEIPNRPNLQDGLRDMTDILGSGDYQLHFKAPGEYYIKVKDNGRDYFVGEKKEEDYEEGEARKPFILKWGM